MTMPSHDDTTTTTGEDEEPEVPFPSFSEQIADQLGGVRGLVESSIPVAVFVVANIVWALRPAGLLSAVVGLGIAGYRPARRGPVRPPREGLVAHPLRPVTAP